MNIVTITCPRCNGLPNAFARFGHIANGLCLRCAGTGKAEVDTDRRAPRSTWGNEADRPYILTCDGMESIASTYRTWDDAKEALVRRGGQTNDGKQLRIAKYDAVSGLYCHRDGKPVVFKFAA